MPKLPAQLCNKGRGLTAGGLTQKCNRESTVAEGCVRTNLRVRTAIIAIPNIKITLYHGIIHDNNNSTI